LRKKLGTSVILCVLVTPTWGATTPDTLAVSAIPTGTISGVVTLEPPPPPRRTVDRYSTRTSIDFEQPVPVVVFLRGEIPGPPPPGYIANPEMAQRDSLFVPAAVALQAGGSVSFPNFDPLFHNVVSFSPPKRFDLGRYPEGESKEVVFDKAGIVDITCEVHEHMHGVIVVTENPYHAVVAEDGSFSIDGVPPGEYTVVAWHVNYQQVERSVTVTDGGTTRIEVELPL
jgi:plastocyanin